MSSTWVALGAWRAKLSLSPSKWGPLGWEELVESGFIINFDHIKYGGYWQSPAIGKGFFLKNLFYSIEILFVTLLT